MERYQVSLYKKTPAGWQLNPPLTEPSVVDATDSYEAAKKVIEHHLDKPIKVFGMSRPPGTLGMFFETVRPGIVIHVEDLKFFQPSGTRW